MYVAKLITRISESERKQKNIFKKAIYPGNICKRCFGMRLIIDQNIKLTFQILTKIFPQRTISGISKFKFS